MKSIEDAPATTGDPTAIPSDNARPIPWLKQNRDAVTVLHANQWANKYNDLNFPLRLSLLIECDGWCYHDPCQNSYGFRRVRVRLPPQAIAPLISHGSDRSMHLSRVIRWRNDYSRETELSSSGAPAVVACLDDSDPQT